MICKICNAIKADTEFYVSNKSCCKECVRARARKRRKENIEAIRAYDRNRPNKTERIQKMKEYKARMREENPEKFDRIFHGIRKRYRETHKEKSIAEGKLNDAIRYGKIKKPETCSICGIKCNPQGHHFDYSKPLDVIWVCVKCHAEIHKKLREGKRSV